MRKLGEPSIGHWIIFSRFKSYGIQPRAVRLSWFSTLEPTLVNRAVVCMKYLYYECKIDIGIKSVWEREESKTSLKCTEYK